GADLRHSEISALRLEAGDARATIVARQKAGFAEFGSGAFRVAFEGIGGGETRGRLRVARIGGASLFGANNAPDGARAEQLHHSDPLIPIPDQIIAWAEADRLLVIGDCVLYLTGQEFAPPEGRYCE